MDLGWISMVWDGFWMDCHEEILELLPKLLRTTSKLPRTLPTCLALLPKFLEPLLKPNSARAAEEGREEVSKY